MRMPTLEKEQMIRAADIHRKSIVVDAHSDRIMGLMREEPYFELTHGLVPRKDFREHLDNLEGGGIKCQVFPVWVSPLYYPVALRRAMQMIDVFQTEVEKNKERISICTTFSEIKRTLGQKRIAAVLSIEGGEPLEGDLGILRIFYRLGVRALGLTQLPRNQLADGSGEMGSKGGLTTFGRNVIEEMNRLNMIVDVSHLNEKGFWDALDASRATVIASHSNCKALCGHHRNLTDDQIRALAKKKGVMGITYVREFLDEKPDKASVQSVLDHIDHVVNLVGADYVGLGSDYMDMWTNEVKELEDITKVPNITKGLVARGYSEDDIEKILGKNFLRVFEEILKD
jgi:membrane dipeptidase